MKLSLTSWSLPACTLVEAQGVSKALGTGALDVGLFYRSALDKALILRDPKAAAAPLADLGVDIPNYYHLFREGLQDRKVASPGAVKENQADLEQVMRYADAAGIGTVFILPGVVNSDQSRAEAARVATEDLKEMVALSRDYAADLILEAHVHLRQAKMGDLQTRASGD